MIFLSFFFPQSWNEPFGSNYSWRIIELFIIMLLINSQSFVSHLLWQPIEEHNTIFIDNQMARRQSWKWWCAIFPNVVLFITSRVFILRLKIYLKYLWVSLSGRRQDHVMSLKKYQPSVLRWVTKPFWCSVFSTENANNKNHFTIVLRRSTLLTTLYTVNYPITLGYFCHY